MPPAWREKEQISRLECHAHRTRSRFLPEHRCVALLLAVPKYVDPRCIAHTRIGGICSGVMCAIFGCVMGRGIRVHGRCCFRWAQPDGLASHYLCYGTVSARDMLPSNGRTVEVEERILRLERVSRRVRMKDAALTVCAGDAMHGGPNQALRTSWSSLAGGR